MGSILRCTATTVTVARSRLTCDLPSGHAHPFHVYVRCIGEDPPFVRWAVYGTPAKPRTRMRGMTFGEYTPIFVDEVRAAKERAR